MADISQQINAINSARYGEEVRGSIVTALTAVNNQVEDDTTSAGASATAAAASASEAAATEARLASAVAAAEQTEEDIEAAEALRVTAENGRVTAENARVAAEQAREDAETGYVAQAQAAAAQAQQYASSDYVKTAQSWAVGGTSSRYGEDTNNAKYWAEIAAEVVTEGGVGSFNGRTGQVLPVTGDYDTTMIARGTGSAESALAAIESGIGTTTLPTTAQTLTGAIAEHESDITALNSKFAFVSGVSTHTLTASGLYYCSADCTDLPSPSPVTTWVIAVIANTAGTTVKQIARAAAGVGYEYERHLLGGTWSGWIDVGRMVPFSGSFTSATYFNKPGNANYGSFLIMGTFGGIGGVIIGCTVSNGSLGSAINLLTGAAWSNTNLTITYGVTDGIGYVGLKTTSGAISSGVIIGG